MFVVLCFFFAAVFFMMAGLMIITGIRKQDMKLKLTGFLSLGVSLLWIAAGSFV